KKQKQTQCVKSPVIKPSQSKKVIKQPVQQAAKKVVVKQAPKQAVTKTVNIAYQPAQVQKSGPTVPVAHNYNKSVANRGNLYA
ncbi:peptidase M23, partial [Staphylococcus aureus]